MKLLIWIEKSLRFISFGKYETKLYHKGNSFYAHPLSGFVSLCLISLLLYFSIEFLNDTFKLKKYNLTESSYMISPYDLKMRDLKTSLFNSTMTLYRNIAPEP